MSNEEYNHRKAKEARRRRALSPESKAKERKYQNEWRNKRHREDKLTILRAYGGQCACCGNTHVEFLTIDHINGEGEIFGTRRDRNNRELYNYLIKENFPRDHYRLLCMNCNFSIGVYGYCPHAKPVEERMKL